MTLAQTVDDEGATVVTFSALRIPHPLDVPATPMPSRLLNIGTHLSSAGYLEFM
jgi:hypothetical protein